MKKAGSPYRLIMKSLEGDKYGIKRYPQGAFDNFVDIGANIGIVSMLVRFVHPHVGIISIEPDVEMYKVLCQNCKDLKIKCVNKAFSDALDKRFKLEKERRSSVCNRYVESSDKNSGVDSVTLPSIFKSRFLKPESTFIKMDCEGAEKYLIGDKESEEILKKCKYISIEVHAGEVYGISMDGFISWFSNLLMETHRIDFCREEDGVVITRAEKVY